MRRECQPGFKYLPAGALFREELARRLPEPDQCISNFDRQRAARIALGGKDQFFHFLNCSFQSHKDGPGVLVEGRDKYLPAYITKEFDEYLKYGRLEHGFLRVRFETCHDEKLVAFSCKRRGFCPSCGARRMADSAALLVDEILPHQPMLPWPLVGIPCWTLRPGQNSWFSAVFCLKSWWDGLFHIREIPANIVFKRPMFYTGFVKNLNPPYTVATQALGMWFLKIKYDKRGFTINVITYFENSHVRAERFGATRCLLRISSPAD
jgi:hypothetical protein